MNAIFTICANNYLAQAKVLGLSLKEHEPATRFIIFLCDEKRADIDYAAMADEVISIADIEPGIDEMAKRYDIVELSTSIKPRAFEYLFNERGLGKVLYLDPDIMVYHPLDSLFTTLATASVLLTPHIYTPVPLDGKTPGEHTFLNYGLYNLGFLGLKNDNTARQLLQWWKSHTYTHGYNRPAQGIFVDQLPMNHVPLFFRDVHILQDRGLNMAPWNLHERTLSPSNGKYIVNGSDALKFYHFSSFRTGSKELPLFYYDRFTLASRPDLQAIHAAYDEALQAAGYFFYHAFKSSYSLKREAHLQQLKKENQIGARIMRKLFARN